MNAVQLLTAYTGVKKARQSGWRSDAASQTIIDWAVTSLRFLVAECEQVTLNSSVFGKNYISFSRNSVVARPANRELFVLDPKLVAREWQSWSRENLNGKKLEQVFYTVALAPCLAMELFDRHNKKGPATYFECMIGHIFARLLGVEPTKYATLSVSGRSVRMTMDFLFETPDGTSNVHLPVKMSTRERVVQAWAHQQLLDSAYGIGCYKGIMVLFSETKLDSHSHEVVEICVPDQWLIYPDAFVEDESHLLFRHASPLSRVAHSFPSVIQIKPFHEFITEIMSVVGR